MFKQKACCIHFRPRSLLLPDGRTKLISDHTKPPSSSLENKEEVAAAVAAAAAEATQVGVEPEAMEEQTELISAEQETPTQTPADETA